MQCGKGVDGEVNREYGNPDIGYFGEKIKEGFLVEVIL